MRILMISDVYHPRVNGVSTSIETFRHELRAAGHGVRLVVPAYPGTREDNGVLRVPSRAVPRDPEDRIMRLPELGRQLRELAREPWDVVHVHTPFLAHYAGARFAARRRVPLVITYHTMFEEYLEHYVPLMPAGAMRAAARGFSRRQCMQADAVIVPSVAMAERLRAYRVAPGRLHVLPTGLPAADFAPGDGAAFRAAHDLAPGRPVALYVGRVAHEKNIAFLLEALRHVRRAIPNAVLLVAGDGPAVGCLQALAAKLRLDGGVRFLGYVPRGPALAGAYAAADLFVFASRTETQGLVLLEAMAQGTPVLALSEMGTRDVLAGCPGAVAGDCRVETFARQWAELLLDADRRAVLSAGARGAASSWRCDAITGRLVELYASLVPQRVRHMPPGQLPRRLRTVLGRAGRRMLARTTRWVAA